MKIKQNSETNKPMDKENIKNMRLEVTIVNENWKDNGNNKEIKCKNLKCYELIHN